LNRYTQFSLLPITWN